MGFGFLLLGYLLFFTMRADLIHADEIISFAGYILEFIALYKLGKYNKGFRWGKYVTAALLPVGFLILLNQVGVILQLNGIPSFLTALEGAYKGLNIAKNCLLLLFHLTVLYGIAEMAQEVELPKLQIAALRNLIIMAVYYGLCIAFSVSDAPFGSFSVYFDMPMKLFELARILLCGICIFNCYRLICLPGDEDMPAGDTLLSRIAHRKDKKNEPKTPEEITAAQKAAYNEEMRRRQEERTKKKKRGKTRR